MAPVPNLDPLHSDPKLKKTTSASGKSRIIAELPLDGILFCTQFPSLGISIMKKVGFWKN